MEPVMDDTSAARALWESEELHRVTLLNMSDAVFITNDDGCFTFICPNADVIFGYSADDVRVMGSISVLFGRDLITPEQITQHSEIQNIEHEIQTKGGLTRALLVHVKRVSIKGGTILYVCRDITDRKRVERELRRNEEGLRLALEAANAGTWDWDCPSGEMTWSPETHRLLGDTTGTRPTTFASFLERIHLSDRERVERTMSDAMDRGSSYEMEFRTVGYDEVERWIMGRGRVLRHCNPPRMLGVFVDLTERHRVEQELLELGGRLINAHEQERMKLSRDLHDDVSQRIALLSAELGQLRRRLPATPDVQDDITRLATDVAYIAEDLHRFAHELHPARLRQLGLEQSVRMFCEELNVARGISIAVFVDGVVGNLPSDVALCLYRVTQEALQNVVRHSRARHAVLRLSRDQGEILLSIADDGIGFDMATARYTGTLGLISMQERVRLVSGRFVVSSDVGGGTVVEVRVPVDSILGGK
jgi:PAS domain S-box-containing protein